MKYYELNFDIKPVSETNNDVLSALLADMGFETFVTTEEGKLQAYIQQNVFDESTLKGLIEFFPIPSVAIAYDIKEAKDENWNERWENEGFKPIYVDRKLVICDTRHAIDEAQLSAKTPVKKILIHPRQAFGTGSHQTTKMILSTLMDMDVAGARIVDAGCGTGILGFLCLKQCAKEVLAYDIDEWSVQNTIDNAALNDLDTSKLEVRLGDSNVLKGESGYDLLIANINRNILIAEIPNYMKALAQKSRILFSGFYNEDVPYLLNATKEYGFELQKQRSDGEWAMILLERGDIKEV